MQIISKKRNTLVVGAVICLSLIAISSANADMEITSTGDVGIGTSTPAASLEVRRANGTATIKVDENSGSVQKRQMFILENNGAVSFRFIDNSAGRVWTFATTDNPPVGEFVLNDPNSPGREFFLDAGGNGEFEGSVSANSFITTSDRNQKDNIKPLEGRDVLRRVMELPISRWSYKSDSTKQIHIGPMAQDFHRLFQVGPDNRHIAVEDASGVALAAIKGLAEMVEAKDAQIEQLIKDKDARIAQLEQALTELRQTVMEIATAKQVAWIK